MLVRVWTMSPWASVTGTLTVPAARFAAVRQRRIVVRGMPVFLDTRRAFCAWMLQQSEGLDALLVGVLRHRPPFGHGPRESVVLCN